MLGFSVSPTDLWQLSATTAAPRIVDVRRRDMFDESSALIPGAVWRDFDKTAEWPAGFDHRSIVVACKAEHESSQIAVAQLRALGFDAGRRGVPIPHGTI